MRRGAMINSSESDVLVGGEATRGDGPLVLSVEERVGSDAEDGDLVRSVEEECAVVVGTVPL